MRSMEPDYNPEEHRNFFSSLSSHFIDFIQTFVVIGAIFALIYLFVAQPHKVSGLSMFPTFHDGDYIMTDKLTPRFSPYKRGDVIVLKNPRDESQDFIKRIIVLPGETVKIQNNSIFINRQILNEPYLPKETIIRAGAFLTENTTITAGSDQYFVMGDNREHSSDSREWGGITKEEIVGKVFFRYFPLQSFGVFNSGP